MSKKSALTARYFLLVGLILLAMPAMGATISIFDLTDQAPGFNANLTGDPPNRTLTITAITPEVANFSFTYFGASSVVVRSPSPNTTLTFDITKIQPAETITVSGFATWTEPDSTLISDQFKLSLDSTKLDVTFQSDTDGISLGTCTLCAAETGQLQPGITVEWFNPSGVKLLTDTFNFQSDIDDTPEPLSAEMLLAGMGLGVVMLGRGKIRHRT